MLDCFMSEVDGRVEEYLDGIRPIVIYDLLDH